MDLSPADFVLLVLLVSFGLVAAFAFVSRTRHARSEARGNTEIVVCRLCLHAFEDLREDRIVPCPVCGARNEKGRRKGPV